MKRQFTYVNDGINKDAETYEKKFELHKGVIAHYGRRDDLVDAHDDALVLRGDKITGGLKFPAMLDYVYRTGFDHYVYVAPKIGYAAAAISLACNYADKKLTLFSPATKAVGWGQTLPHVFNDHVDHCFIRTAALKNLRAVAKKWCDKHGAHYIPFGLTETPMITNALSAFIKRACDNSEYDIDSVKLIVCACSTGMLLRASMLAYPDIVHAGVAVCRNMQAGETGDAYVISTPYQWEKPAELLPETFDTCATYDGKAWEVLQRIIESKPGLQNERTLFLNVARDINEREIKKSKQIAATVLPPDKTSVDWNKVKIIRR